MSREIHREWMVDDSCDPDTGVGYYFSRNYGSCAEVILLHDGTLVFDGLVRKVMIKNIGTENEQVVVEKGADLIV